MRRLRAAAIIGAARQPKIAPRPSTMPATPLDEAVLLAILPVHGGTFCTAPQVPRRATEAKQMARSAVTQSAGLPKSSWIGLDLATFWDSFHLCDSGTKIWMMKVSSAGAAPA